MRLARTRQVGEARVKIVLMKEWEVKGRSSAERRCNLTDRSPIKRVELAKIQQGDHLLIKFVQASVLASCMMWLRIWIEKGGDADWRRRMHDRELTSLISS